MDDMKCPFCGKKLWYDEQDGIYRCMKKYACVMHYEGATEQLWQELIRTRKALEQSETCCSEWEKQALDYKAENIVLSGELECTCKALDVAVDALKLFYSGQFTLQLDAYGIKKDASCLAHTSLAEIKTTVEQKDVK